MCYVPCLRLGLRQVLHYKRTETMLLFQCKKNNWAKHIVYATMTSLYEQAVANLILLHKRRFPFFDINSDIFVMPFPLFSSDTSFNVTEVRSKICALLSRKYFR